MAERHLKVLLIEDNPGDVRLIREMLVEAKAVAFQLEAADCLSAGLEQLAQAEVDLILLDLSLPDSLGLETFQMAYAKAAGVPIVVLSGSDDEELAMRAVQAGAQDYLVKDQVDSHLLSRAIQYAVERERGRKERLQLLAREQEARAEAVQAEQRFHDILHGLHAIVWEADAQTWQFTFVSQRAAEILGYPIEEWLTQPHFWVDHIHPEDRARSIAYCQQCTAHGSDHEFEYRAVAADGRIVWLQDIVHVVQDAAGHVRQLRGVMVDITEHKRVQEELKARARQQAAVAEFGQRALANLPLDELCDDAVALIARTLDVEYCKVLQLLPGGKTLRLQAGVCWKEGLVGHALLEADVGSQAGYVLRSKQPVVVEDLRTEKRFRGTGLLHDHGVVSGLGVIIQTGGQPFGILSAHTRQRRTFTEDDIHFLQAIAHVLGTAIDRRQVEEALRQAREELELRVREVPLPRRLALTTRYDSTLSQVILDVADTGPGVPTELQKRIFEPFFTTKPLGISTGLGLPFCKGIVEGHGGSISVESQAEPGAVFRIKLPVETTLPPIVPTQAPEALRPIQGKSILIIDDEVGIAMALAALLRRDGFKVDTAGNGRLALEKLQGQAYDLLLCDLRMPELDGPGLYRELEIQLPHLVRRVIFLTGDTLSPEVKKFLEKAGLLRLDKPFRAAEVRQVVQQALQAF